jgi:CRISPR-associated protein Csb2
MPATFCLTVRFLDPAYHGRENGGEPEWPPSPLRAFQALVAAAGALGRGQIRPADREALVWLERLPPPTVVAPTSEAAEGYGYRLSVPNNSLDRVAEAWARGNDSNVGDANPATHRTMKPVRPTWLRGGDSVHWLWGREEPMCGEASRHVEVLSRLAASIVALGWGIDLAIGRGAILAEEDVARLDGERWLPSGADRGKALRVPRPGTLDELVARHGAFLGRIIDGGSSLAPPTPLSRYAIVRYTRRGETPPRPVAAFSLLRLDGGGFRPFDAVRRALSVAGMLRHATARTARIAGWAEARVESFVLGHGEKQSERAHAAVGHRRFAYLPVPTIEARGDGTSPVAGSVRRVLVASFAEGCEDEIAWARGALSGQELVSAGLPPTPVALLSHIPESDSRLRCYLAPAATWATVTPVVLPGYDDPAHFRRRLAREPAAEKRRALVGRLEHRVAKLMRKAIVQAGFPSALAQHAELDWCSSGFWPGVDLASRYGVPDHLRRFPRLHVRLTWRDAAGNPVKVPGPICLGGGRFFGVGLFAAIAEPRSMPRAP